MGDVNQPPALDSTVFLSTVRVLNALGAACAIDAAEAEARRLGCRIVVTVTDNFGFPIASRRMDGAPLASITLAHAKARTAAWLKISTTDLQGAVDAGKVSYLSAHELTPLEGGLPIAFDTQIVGAVGVSGGEVGHDSAIAAAAVKALELC